ncbi:hypothetical protein H0H87_004959 [Tephrocybe sp. NHM501043]|nr:hypothetical protein H0H87_004959 [Tephrocybe sp. NHM501043]
MQASGLYASPSPHPLYHSAYHPILPGPQDHELKKQYLTLLPPQQIIDICLNFDLHVPPYVKSSIWPADLNAAIAAMQKTSPLAAGTPVALTSNLNGSNPAMNSLENPPRHAPATSNSIDKPSEAQPPDKPPTPPPEATTSATTSVQPSPAPPEQPTPATTTSAPAATGAVPPSAPTTTPQQPPYPHQPYGYHPQTAYPHAPYYQAPPGYPPYPTPYAYPHQMHAAYPQPHLAYPQPTTLPYAPPPVTHPPPQQPQDVFNSNPGSTDDLPSYEEMIVEALTDSADPEGCAPKDLFTWMASHYPLQSNFRPSASQALQKAFKRGRFQKSSGGKYRLNTSWEGGNTSRRTTRRPQTQNPPSASPAPASPFTHAPLVHHNQSNQTPAFQSQPFGYPYQQQQQAVQSSFSGFTHNGQAQTTTTAASTTAGTEASTAQDAWEAAQNILKAINFDSLLSLKDDEGGEAEQPVAGPSSSPVVSTSVVPSAPNVSATANEPAAASAETTGMDVYAAGRAELQAHLALLAAQLAELSQEDEDDPVVHYPVIATVSTSIAAVATAAPVAATEAPVGAVPPPVSAAPTPVAPSTVAPPTMAASQMASFPYSMVPMYAPPVEAGAAQRPVPPISVPKPPPPPQPVEPTPEEEEDSDEDDMEEVI